LLEGMEGFENKKAAEEGGRCGVVGFAASVPVRGRHIFEPSMQMHNRGNGKGGGIAAGGMVPEQLGVDEKTLNEAYLLQIALLDPKAESEVEKQFVTPFFDVAHKTNVAPKTDHREFGLETKPPDIVRYFVRVKDKELEKFAKKNGLEKAPSPNGRGRVRLSQHLQPQQDVLRLAGRKSARSFSRTRET